MSDQSSYPPPPPEPSSQSPATSQPSSSRRVPGVGEGLRAGIGILTAFKEAIEETIQEASSRGDLSPDRARGALGTAMTRAQEAVEEVRERLDVVPRREFDALRAEVEALRRRVEALEGGRRTEIVEPGAEAGSTPPAPSPGSPAGGDDLVHDDGVVL